MRCPALDKVQKRFIVLQEEPSLIHSMDGCGTLRGVQYLKILRHKSESNQQSQWIFTQNHLQHLPKKEFSKKLRANIVSSQAKNFHSDQHSTTFEISSRPPGLAKKGGINLFCFLLRYQKHVPKKIDAILLRRRGMKQIRQKIADLQERKNPSQL